MKKSDYSNIKSIEQLRAARSDNKCHMVRAEARLKEDFLSLKDALSPESIFSEIISETVTFVSRFCLYRRVYMLIRSFFRKISY